MNPYATARQAYAESAILTASPGRLVVMLYDGAIRSLRQSAAAMRGGDRERARTCMRKAEAIIDELNGSLDMSVGELPDRLRSIYHFCKRHLIHANVMEDAAAIDTVVGLLADLRESWDRAARTTEPVDAA
jgi:flagellar secretion chaperone FliS